MDERLKILHLEDNDFDAEIVERTLRKAGLNPVVTRVTGVESFEKALNSGEFDVALCDYSVPGFNGFAALQEIRLKAPDLPVILLSGALGEEEAVECLRNGATDYILKGRLHRLVPAIRRALEEARLRREHRKADEALRLNEERLRCVLMATDDAVYDLNVVTKKIWWNQGLRMLFGYNPREVEADLNWWETNIHPEDRIRVVNSFAGAVQGRASAWEEEYRFYCSDGSYSWVYDRGYILREPSGKASRVVGAMMDITEKKRLESEVLRAQRMDTIGSIAGGVAHDLNNMLTPILVASDLLSDFVSGPEAEQFLELIRKSVVKGTDLVQQIVAFAKGSGDVKTLIDLKEFGEESLALVKRTFPRNVKVEFEVEPNVRAGYGNKTQLHQVLLNLCVNARDAMPSGGTVKVRIGEETKTHSPEAGTEFDAPHRFVVLEVEDTGCGISAENLGKLFSPFFSTKKAGQGTGLGLPTVRNIVKAHQGYITVASEVGKGTKFSVFLPAGLAVDSMALKETAHLRGDGECVLLVGVDSSVVQLMRTALESHHYKVLTAHNGQEAVKVAEKARDGDMEVRVMIAEVDLARGNIEEMIQKLRRLFPEIGTIYTVPQNVTGISVVVDRTLKKPFSTKDLLDAVAYSLMLHKPAVAA